MEITAEVIAAFRTNTPQFKDDTKWDDTTVTLALCEGDAETGGSGWGEYDSTDCQNFKGRGLYAYAAHWLKSFYPGGSVCPEDVKSDTKLAVASKSVGDESISFATGAVDKLSIGDSWLASTVYGQQWLRLRKRAGMGARTTGRNARVLIRGSFGNNNGLC